MGLLTEIRLFIRGSRIARNQVGPLDWSGGEGSEQTRTLGEELGGIESLIRTAGHLRQKGCDDEFIEPVIECHPDDLKSKFDVVMRKIRDLSADWYQELQADKSREVDWAELQKQPAPKPRQIDQRQVTATKVAPNMECVCDSTGERFNSNEVVSPCECPACGRTDWSGTGRPWKPQLKQGVE